MAQFRGLIPLIVAIISLKSLNSCGNNKVAVEKVEKTNSANQIQEGGDTLLLSVKDYKVVLSNINVLDIEITSQHLISLIKTTKYSIITIEIEGVVKLAKGNDVFRSFVPENCDYFFPLNKGFIVLINNKINFRKVVNAAH